MNISIWGYVIGIAIVLVFISIRRKGAETAIKDATLIMAEPLQISSSTKKSLEKFSIRDTSELRQMNSGQLQEFLSLSANVIGLFEERIEKLSYACDAIKEYLGGNDNSIARDTKKVQEGKGILLNKDYKAKLSEKNKIEQAMSICDEQLLSMESALIIIPEKYRMSLILYQFCEYLADGEVDSWEGCIKTFKEDVFRMQQNENFQNVINHLEVIERNTANIAKNTKTTAFFAGITAWK